MLVTYNGIISNMFKNLMLQSVIKATAINVMTP